MNALCLRIKEEFLPGAASPYGLHDVALAAHAFRMEEKRMYFVPLKHFFEGRVLLPEGALRSAAVAGHAGRGHEQA